MADVSLMSNPMTTAGDVIQGGASGAPSRLAIGTAGQVLKVNAGATALEYADETAGGDAAWTTFTPTWTAASANPVIGNGTLAGAYLIRGKSYQFRIHVVMGSTTTFGSGRWSLTLGGSVSTIATYKQVAAAYALDSSAGTADSGVAWITDGASPLVRPVFGHAAGGNGMTSTTPFIWASGDELHIQGVIEIA